MKHLIFLMALLALVMLGGCRFDPNALLGNDPADEPMEVLDSSDAYQLCREQNVIVGGVENASGCATPANLSEFLSNFQSGEDNTIRVEFYKMWDGSFPKLVQLQYHTGQNGKASAAKNVTCQIETSAATVRAYRCKLEATAGNDWGIYTFQSMTLGHDTCASKAVYTAQFLYDICTDPDNYYYASSIDVFFNRERLPTLNPWVAPQKP